MCIDLHIDDSTCLDYRTVGDMALDIAVQNKKTLNVDSYRSGRAASWGHSLGPC